MTTAIEDRLKINVTEIRARQYAAMILHQIRHHISDSSYRDAEYELYTMFRESDVIITTSEQRHAEAVMAAHEIKL